ncbi:MAG: hypothetical protein QM501_12485 [Gimesia sp.]
MKKIVPLFTILFVCLASVHAKTPKSYEMGFDAVSVFDYKQALKKEGEDIPKFPPRTGNALIVESVKYDSRALKAGLEVHDLIQIVNGKLLRNPADADKIFQKITYKDELELKVIRREDNKWKRITVTLEPISDLDHFRSVLRSHLEYDYEFDLKYYVWHVENSHSNCTHKNFQLYYTKNSEKSPDTLYLQLSLFLPDTSSMLNETTMAGFIVKTDTAKYRIAKVDEIWEREKAFKNKLAEANKLIQAAHNKVIEAESKNKSKEEVTKLLKELALGKVKYQEIQTAQSKYLKHILKQDEQHEEILRKKFMDIYFDFSERRKRMVDELIEKTNNLGSDVSELTLMTLGRNGFFRMRINLLRVFQGWIFYDVPLKKTQLKMIEDIISSRKVTVHFETAPNKPFELTPEQKERMKIVLKVFEADGGKIAE